MLKKIIESPGFNAVVRGKHGFVVYNKNDFYIGKAIEKYGEYSEAEISLFRQFCREGDKIVEIGANIGAHTLALSRAVSNRGRIYAFEPQRIVFQTLCANMSINSIENVECYQLAASSKDGIVRLPDIRYDIEGNFGGMEIDKYKMDTAGAGYTVRQVQLDSVLDPPSLKLLKIDVEGMERDVLQGAASLIETYKPVLYVENDRVDKSKDLIEHIRSLNYRMFWLLPPLFNPNNYAGCAENIYAGEVSVNMLCFHSSVDIKIEGFSEVLDSDLHPLKK